MKNSEYWAQRFAQLEEAQNRLGADALADIEKQYDEAIREIERQIARWYLRFAKNNEISLADARQWLRGKDLKEFKWDVHEYIRHGEENALDGRWMKELENASARYHISKLDALKIRIRQSLEELHAKQDRTFTSAMGDVYKSGYYHTAFELQKGFSIGWDIAGIDNARLEKVLSKPWAADGYNFSERIWNDKQKLIQTLHQELTRNILTGADPQKAIDAVSKRMEVSKRNAGRLVMTEEAYFSSAAQKEAFQDLGVEEFEIVATLDSHTSEICQEMDGKHFPMSEYEPGETAPPFHPNCRSTTAPYFEDDFGSIGERAARDEKGNTYYVPADMKYGEWKKAFVDGREKNGLEELMPHDIIKNRGQQVPRTKSQFEATTNKIKKDITKYSQNSSKWSGKIKVVDAFEDDTVGRKEWSCDIALLENADDGTLWHEMLHSCSSSYYTPDVYFNNQSIEEASVEFLTQQICKEQGIVTSEAYTDQVIVLKELNRVFHYGTDMEFAKELFNIPLPQRYQWLEDRVDDSLRKENASFEDFNDVMAFVQKLKGAIK